MIRRYLVFLLIVAAGLITAVAYKPAPRNGWPDRADNKQLKFSHKTHIAGAGVACENCHPAATSKLASDNLRAGHDNCQSCHEEQLGSQCNYCHVDPENIQPAAAAVRELLFSHERHVSQKNVECATCHPGLEEADYATPKHMPSMATCNTCHNDRKVTNACEACHTSFVRLVPPDHLVGNFKKEHKQLTRLGTLETSCSTCHTQSFCAECHAPAALAQFGKGALMADPTPRTFPGNGSQQMSLQLAHDMNYRFTHGIDAKAKSADCYSCHSQQEFCAECHATGDNITASAFTPAWHLGAGFATIGVGSGGGTHATLARRDIESCVSCHDTQGNDPVCVTCHVDADGIRGTDPRTHPGSFMKDEHGPWHTSAGATCFNCHTDLNARPDGTKGRNFCGYCHR